jgi:hypothetical protein
MQRQGFTRNTGNPQTGKGRLRLGGADARVIFARVVYARWLSLEIDLIDRHVVSTDETGMAIARKNEIILP